MEFQDEGSTSGNGRDVRGQGAGEAFGPTYQAYGGEFEEGVEGGMEWPEPSEYGLQEGQSSSLIISSRSTPADDQVCFPLQDSLPRRRVVECMRPLHPTLFLPDTCNPLESPFNQASSLPNLEGQIWDVLFLPSRRSTSPKATSSLLAPSVHRTCLEDRAQ